MVEVNTFNGTMKLLYGLIALVGVVCGQHLQQQILFPTSTLIRTPQYDSAIVQNERIGGSFSYSTIEGHAYENSIPLATTVSILCTIVPG